MKFKYVSYNSEIVEVKGQSTFNSRYADTTVHYNSLGLPMERRSKMVPWSQLKTLKREHVVKMIKRCKKNIEKLQRGVERLENLLETLDNKDKE